MSGVGLCHRCLSPCPFHCRGPAHSAASACVWVIRGLCQQSVVCYKDTETQDFCQDHLFFRKLDFSMLLLGSSSSHRTVLPEKSRAEEMEEGGRGEEPSRTVCTWLVLAISACQVWGIHVCGVWMRDFHRPRPAVSVLLEREHCWKGKRR